MVKCNIVLFHMNTWPKCFVPSQCQSKVLAQKFTTISLGAQLQALYSTPESAQAMHYCQDKTHKTQEKYPNPDNPSGPQPKQLNDYIHGSDYLDCVHDGKIKDTNILLMLSLDGAQLYEHCSSDCWMYMWVVLELGPDCQYKKTHVLPGSFIPGPNKPKNVNSLLFPALYHLAALQKESLKIYDASMKESYIARPLVYFATADAPGMVYLSGLVGHSGAHGCCNYCEVPWQHKFTGSHYYPVLHLPDNYHSNHTEPFPDIDLNQHELILIQIPTTTISFGFLSQRMILRPFGKKLGYPRRAYSVDLKCLLVFLVHTPLISCTS